MPYKTVSIKLLHPTAKKSAFLDDAMERYSSAFEILLRQCRVRFSDTALTKAAIMKAMDKDFFQFVAHLNIEPFKDALKMDLAKLISIYHAGLKRKPQTAFPVTRTENADLEDFLHGIPLSKRQADALFDKYHNRRPLLFCRFDDKRDYSLVKSEKGDFYAKLYLFSRKNVPGPERFLHLPLLIADWQKGFMEDMLSGTASPKSAELIRRKGQYFLNVRFWYELPETRATTTYLGVARGLNTPLCYTVSDKNGMPVAHGTFDAPKCSGKNKLHHLANIIVSTAAQYNSQIVMVNLTARSDGLKTEKFLVPLGVGEYNAATRLTSYKAEACGLPPPVPVSGNSLFFKCPKCGSFKKSNRFGNDKFICIHCGYSNELEIIGSSNLSRMLILYKKNKVPVHYALHGSEIHFWLEALDFSFSCEAGPEATRRFTGALQVYMKEKYETFDKGRQFTAKKLKGEKALEHLHFIETRSFAR